VIHFHAPLIVDSDPDRDFGCATATYRAAERLANHGFGVVGENWLDDRQRAAAL